MSDNNSRIGRARKPLLIGAAALCAVALVGGVVTWAFTPEVVPESEITITPQPPKVPAGEPVVAAPEDTDTSEVVDVTRDLTPGFTGDLIDARSRAQDEQGSSVVVETDECLLDWAKGNLAALVVDGAYEVVTVCDRPTAVLAGPAGADTKVLVYGSLEETAPEGMLEVLGASTSDRMAFVAVRTADGNAQLLAAAELPSSD